MGTSESVGPSSLVSFLRPAHGIFSYPRLSSLIYYIVVVIVFLTIIISYLIIKLLKFRLPKETDLNLICRLI
jgi:predicted Na+-dependent transporter